jgi:hypothetical protein
MSPLRLALVLAALACSSAHASVVYLYTGNGFDQFTGSPGVDGSNFISATLTFDSPLAGGLSLFDASSTVQSWSITDGVHTLTSSTPGVTVSDMFVSTDAGGNIIAEWLLYIHLGNEQLITEDCPGFCFSVSDKYHDISDVAAVVGSPGIWTIETAPEPSSAWLLLAGPVLWIVRRRRWSRSIAQLPGA